MSIQINVQRLYTLLQVNGKRVQPFEPDHSGQWPSTDHTPEGEMYRNQSIQRFTCNHLAGTSKGYPLYRENRENGKKKIPVRENTGNLEILPNHRENTGFSHFVNSLILKVNDILIFPAKNSKHF